MSAAAVVANAMDASSLTGNAGANNATGNATATPDRQPKERHSLSLDQRRNLRRWANAQTVRPSHKACIEWFNEQYGLTISQSTVSHSLSPKYARLDGDPALSGSRLRFGNWPDVEKLVLMWHHSMVSSGRQPTNEELADKAKSIFQQLPRYKDEQPPEFSPGWIHRFKKRYGLLVRRQRRNGNAPPPQDDIPYLVDTVPRFMNVAPETSPAAIREAVNRIVGVEPSLPTCARVRDEICRRMEASLISNTPPAHGVAVPPPVQDANGSVNGSGDVYGEDDPETILQNALHALQQEEADAEAQAAAERETRLSQSQSQPSAPPPPAQVATTQSYAQQAAGAALATPIKNGVVHQPPGSGAGASAQPQQQSGAPRFTPIGAVDDDLNLTPIQADGPVATNDRPMRCPFCLNKRMLRTIKEAVEHMSTHVVL